MPVICFTVDLDRDVNILVPGLAEAGSIDRGAGTAPRFTSSIRGLHLLSDLLDELHMPATFFAEGRTLEHVGDSRGCIDGFEIGVHGYDHEDLTLLDRSRAESCIHKAIDIVKDLSGTYPKSFRAPYMRKPGYLNGLLVTAGFSADSSEYVSNRPLPYKDVSGIVEVPVFHRGISKAASGYLWPMHEGKRGPGSYLDLVKGLEEDAIVVLADHTWHIVESRSFGILDEAGVRKQLDSVRTVLEGLLDSGFEPKTISEAVASNL